ncbi:MAG: DUF4350 domain-containing protein, partial [Cyanobacteria bacterium P01_F01_bin.86]
MIASGPNRRTLSIALLALVIIGFALFLLAPASNRLNSGSTWGYAPDGYGAWYADMQAQGAAIQRWQRPIPELLEQAQASPADAPITLLRVMPRPVEPGALFFGESWWQEWLEQGHHLIVLAQQEPVSGASFITHLDTAVGPVTIATRRRATSSKAAALLGDTYGAVVWRQDTESGELILATTPFLAANAYRDAPGNFAFLADLVQQAGGTIWVDEYLHGYKDRDVVIEDVAGNWLSYLAKTPWLVAGVQVGIVLLLALIAHNRRPGRQQTIPSFPMNDSESYIQALASVLHKANSRDFLVETLTRA